MPMHPVRCYQRAREAAMLQLGETGIETREPYRLRDGRAGIK